MCIGPQWISKLDGLCEAGQAKCLQRRGLNCAIQPKQQVEQKQTCIRLTLSQHRNYKLIFSRTQATHTWCAATGSTRWHVVYIFIFYKRLGPLCTIENFPFQKSKQPTGAKRNYSSCGLSAVESKLICYYTA